MDAGTLWLMPFSSVSGREGTTPNSHDVLPIVGRADGDVVDLG
jgi:hypothetical protein